MGPLETTLSAPATPRVNAKRHPGRERVVADPCFTDHEQSVSALTHATQWADDGASERATAVMHSATGRRLAKCTGSCILVPGKNFRAGSMRPSSPTGGWDGFDPVVTSLGNFPWTAARSSARPSGGAWRTDSQESQWRKEQR